MSAQNREAAISETLKWEGGYSNDVGDPGGPTNWGITIHDARAYWKADATALDVRRMPKSVAVDIYRKKYWKTPYYDCDTIEPGVDLSVFDFGVNSGPSRAHAALMASIGGSSEDTINKINNYRMHFLRGLGTFGRFGVGWTRRVTGIRSKSLQMAKGQKINRGKVVGGIIAIGGAAGAQAFNLWQYWPYMILAAVLGLITWAIIKGNKNEPTPQSVG